MFSFLQGNRLVMLGEWSLGLPPPGTNKNPIITEEDYEAFGKAQLDIYGRLAKAGWAFWSYKIEDEVNTAWNFRDSRSRGWLPFEEVDQWDRLTKTKKKNGTNGGAPKIGRNGEGWRKLEVQ